MRFFRREIPTEFPGANEEQAGALRRIVAAIQQAIEDPDPADDGLRIYLCGCGGSGKTWTTGHLARTLAWMEGIDVDAPREPGMTLPSSSLLTPVTPTLVAAKVATDKLRAAGIGNEVSTIHSAVYLPVWRQPDTERIAQFLEAVASGAPRDDVPRELRLMVEREYLSAAIDAGVEDILEARKAAATLKDADLVGAALRAGRADPLDVLLDTDEGDQGWQLRVGELSPVVLVDEASMVTELTARRLQSLCRVLILVGDPLQLGPVVPNLAIDTQQGRF
jgi:hypothetical protein